MLAKEAAQEAKEKKNLPPVISLGDVKETARKSGFVKWQEMWEKSEKGRHLFQFRPKVNLEIAHTFQSSFGERIISQLRTGYVHRKLHHKKDANCPCGEKETLNHY